MSASIFNSKAVDEVIASELPDFIKHELRVAKKYSEGRTIQIEIKSQEQFKYISELIRIKLRNI